MAVEEERMISPTIITVEALIGIEEVMLMYIENKGFPIDNNLRYWSSTHGFGIHLLVERVY